MKLLIILILISITSIFPHVQFTSHIITMNEPNIEEICVEDVDGDEDLDVAVALFLTNEMYWYENLSIVGIEKISNEIPTEFNLRQNFPNPFNPGTTISFSIPEASFISLKLFNSLGEEIETLVSKELNPGNYKYV